MRDDDHSLAFEFKELVDIKKIKLLMWRMMGCLFPALKGKKLQLFEVNKLEMFLKYKHKIKE